MKPWCKVIDYREAITGIKKEDLSHAPSFPKVAHILKKILHEKVVVGHSIQDNFDHLKLYADEYKCVMRDVSNYIGFMKAN